MCVVVFFVMLKECFIPLNPVRFSSSILAAMDAVVPSRLPTPEHSDTAVPQDKTVICIQIVAVGFCFFLSPFTNCLRPKGDFLQI